MRNITVRHFFKMMSVRGKKQKVIATECNVIPAAITYWKSNDRIPLRHRDAITRVAAEIGMEVPASLFGWED